jgi:hypothetical protein
VTFTPTAPNFAAVPRPAFGRAAQHLPGSPGPVRTRGLARYQRAAKTAAELLPELPQRGEAIHALMTGEYDLCQVIASVARPLPSLRHLRIATLCFSRRNAAELLGLIEDFPRMRLTLLVSSFFKGHNKDLYEWFAEELTDHSGARLRAARSHCKVATFDFGRGDGLVFEGSANLRTNKNREQLTAIRDRRLHDWHAAWIDDLTSSDDAEKEGE